MSSAGVVTDTPSGVSAESGSQQLQRLQAQLEAFYEVPNGFDIDQYLVTDRRLSDYLESSEQARDVEEKLLIAEDDDGVAVTLFVDQALLQRLGDVTEDQVIESDRLNDYCVALEGVSHFVYFTFKASFDRPVSRLELELQAEVDKYMSLTHWSDSDGRSHPKLHEWLFVNPNFDSSLSDSELSRYRSANELASRFCSHLQSRYLSRHRLHECRRQLCRFYRLSERKKLDWIRST